MLSYFIFVLAFGLIFSCGSGKKKSGGIPENTLDAIKKATDVYVPYGLHGTEFWSELPIKVEIGNTFLPNEIQKIQIALEIWETIADIDEPLFEIHQGISFSVEEGMQSINSVSPGSLIFKKISQNWCNLKSYYVAGTTLWTRSHLNGPIL